PVDAQRSAARRSGGAHHAKLPRFVQGGCMRRVWLLALLWAGLAQATPADDFFRAVQLDDERTVQALLAAKFDPNTAEPQRGENGLILAIREDANRVFALLLAQPGVRVDQAAVNGDTALMVAAFKHRQDAVLQLIAHGAAINRAGWTPLHYAA